MSGKRLVKFNGKLLVAVVKKGEREPSVTNGTITKKPGNSLEILGFFLENFQGIREVQGFSKAFQGNPWVLLNKITPS